MVIVGNSAVLPFIDGPDTIKAGKLITGLYVESIVLYEPALPCDPKTARLLKHTVVSVALRNFLHGTFPRVHNKIICNRTVTLP